MDAGPDMLKEALGILEDATLAFVKEVTLDIVEMVVKVEVEV
jgi:hypothetical protein